tara:strand:+ start:59 stop:1222 length:1164 start_codon:yes stop_codon:yes gene_type:complete
MDDVQDFNADVEDIEVGNINDESHYDTQLELELQDIKNTLLPILPKNPNPMSPLESEQNSNGSNSNSPLTISYNNSEDEMESKCNHFRELSYEEIEHSLDKYYENKNTSISSELDILITFMKGQKNLFIQSYLVSQRKLNLLMIPAILIASAVTIFTPISQDFSWNVAIISGLNAITAMLISLINYLKLDVSTKTFYDTATQYDKLESSLEFVASKFVFINDECDKSKIVFEKIHEVENKINEIKEWNTLFIPDEVRYQFPIICNINVFSFIKRMECSKRGLIERFKGVKNEIRYINHKLDEQQSERLIGRLHYLSSIKHDIRVELNHFRNAYGYIDGLFTMEIKNAQNISLLRHWISCLRQTKTYNTHLSDNNNPVVDKYIQFIFE